MVCSSVASTALLHKEDKQMLSSEGIICMIDFDCCNHFRLAPFMHALKVHLTQRHPASQLKQRSPHFQPQTYSWVGTNMQSYVLVREREISRRGVS